MIYLDNAATTFPKPEVVYDTVDFVQRNLAVNIGRGSYQTANSAMKIVDETRYLMAELVHADNPNNVIFTPSATVAANEIIFGLDWDEFKTVYVTPFEHNAIVRPLKQIEKIYGVEIKVLPFDVESHCPNYEKIETMFASNPPDYIFLNQISNVTGTVVPVTEIANLGKLYNALIIVDGSQSVGLLEIDMVKQNIDYLIFAGHKNLYASWGIGGFISRSKPCLNPVIFGGTGTDSLNLSMGNESPVRFEPASPNIIAIASLNSSIKWLKEQGINQISLKKKELVARLIEGLQECDCILYLPNEDVEHTSVVSFNIEGFLAGEVGTILSQDFDIAVRTGYHCAPYIHEFLDTKQFEGTVRVSIGYFNTEEDIEAFIEAVKDI